MFLAQTFEPKMAKHALHPPIKLMQKFCQGRPIYAKVANGLENQFAKTLD